MISFFDSVKHEAYIIVKDNLVTDTNSEFCSFSGYMENEILGINMDTLFQTLLRGSLPQMLQEQKKEILVFTKMLEPRFVELQKNMEKDTSKTYYVFREIPNSRFECNNAYLAQLCKTDFVGVAVYTVPEMILVKANQKYLDFMEAPFHQKEVSIGKRISEIITNWKGSPAEQFWQEAITLNKSVNVTQYEHKGFARGVTYWDSIITPVLECGKLKYVVSNTHEVTDKVMNRKKVEEQLEVINLKNKQMEAVIENMSDALLIYDNKGNASMANESAKNIFFDSDNYKQLGDSTKTTRYFDVDGNFIEPHNFPVARALRGERVTNYFLGVERPDKVIYYSTNSSPVYDKNGEIAYAFACMHDITDLIEKEIELQKKQKYLFRLERERKEQLEAFLENLEEAVFIYDKDNKPYLQNKVARSYYPGVVFESVEDVLNGAKYFYLDGNEIPKDSLAVTRVQRGESIKNLMEKMVSGGITRYISVSGGWLYDNQGKKTFCIILYNDITNYIESQQALIEAKEAAEAGNKAKSQFLANMSHEIRTPMNGIFGFAELLSMTEVTEQQREMINLLKTSSTSLLSIINDILDLSKIEVGKVEIKPSCVNFVDFINRIEKIYSVLVKEKDIEFRTKIGQDIPTQIYIDGDRLNQIIVNLISNAIKFTFKGQIELSVKKLAVDKNKVQLLIAVSDTGIGIHTQDIPRLFNYFTQLDDSKTKEFKGTGLGLAISKRLVELMEGEMWCESEYGSGSTFCFTIWAEAVIKNEAELVSKQMHIPEVKQGSINLLLVEDDFTCQLILSTFGKKENWSIDIASDGKQALKMHESKRYDCILMDIQMPEMSGIEVTKIIREKEKVSGLHTPIVAITAYVMNGDREDIMKSGMDGYLSKPIDFKELKKVVLSYAVGQKSLI